MGGRKGEVLKACLLFCLVIGSLFAFVVAKRGAPLPISYLENFLPGFNSPSVWSWHPLLYDGVGQFLVWRKLAGEALREGIFPLWNPFSFCGHPFLANGQSALLYPPTWLFTFLPPLDCFTFVVFLHLFGAALGTFLWLRRRAGYASSALGGLAYALSAPLVLKIPVLTHLCVSSLLPWVLLGVERALKRRNPRAVALCAASLALPILAGHFQMASFVWLAAICYGLFLLPEVERPERAKELLAIGSAAILAIVFALPLILPTAEFAKVSHRATSPSLQGWEFFKQTALHPAMFLSLISNGAFLLPEGGYIGPTDFVEGTGYVSVILLPLAALSLLRRRKEATFPSFLCLLSLLVATATPAAFPLYLLMPASATPSRALFLWAFGMASLGALGLDEAERKAPSRGEIAKVALCVLLTFVFLLVVARATWPVELSALVGADLILSLFSLGLLFSLTLKRAQEAIFASFIALFTCLLGSACSLLKGVFWGSFLRGGWQGVLEMALFGLPFAVIAFWLISMLLSIRQRPTLRAAWVILLADLLLSGFSTVPTEGWEGKANYRMEVRDLNRLAQMGQRRLNETFSPFLRRRLVGAGRVCGIIVKWPLSGQPIASLPPNTASLGGALDISGYDSLHLMAYRQLLGALQGRDPSPPENGNIAALVCPKPTEADKERLFKALKALGGKVLLSPFPIPYHEKMSFKCLGLGYFVSEARPLAFVPPRIVKVKDWHKGAMYLGSNKFDPLSEAVVVSKDVPPTGRGRTIQAFVTWDGLWAEVGIQKTSLVVLLVPAAPGTKVWIDGEKRQFSLADMALICVLVPEGRHKIKAIYHPSSFSIALFVALLSLSACVGLIATERVKR